MAGPLRQFDRSLPMQLLRAREAVMKEFMPALRAEGLTAQQWRVIRALVDEDGLDMSAIAERCFLLLPSLSRIIQNLESRGMVTRSGSREDQRRSLIRLTRDGRDVFARVAPKSEARYEALTERFGYGKLELLYELLEELIERLDDDAEDEAGQTPDND